MSTTGTWALVLAVVIVIASRHLLITVSADTIRKARSRATRIHAASEGTARRRAAADLHVPDWVSEGWVGGDVPSTAGPHHAARPSTRKAA